MLLHYLLKLSWHQNFKFKPVRLVVDIERGQSFNPRGSRLVLLISRIQNDWESFPPRMESPQGSFSLRRIELQGSHTVVYVCDDVRLVSLNKVQPVLSQICDYGPLSVKCTIRIGQTLFKLTSLNKCTIRTGQTLFKLTSLNNSEGTRAREESVASSVTDLSV